MPMISGKSLAKTASSFITGMVAVCPLLLSVFCALPNFFGGWGLVWDGHPYDFYFLPDIKRHLLGGVALACVWGGCFVWFCKSQFRTDARHLPLKLFLITLVSRGVLALTIGQFASPVSDFAFAWDRACAGCVTSENGAHLLFPAWMSFSMFERCWVLAFGSNMGVALFAGAVLNAITAVMMFQFAMYMFERREVAFAASSLYVFYPTSIVYTMTASPEHMCVACFMTMSVMLAECMSKETAVGRRLMLIVCAGVIAGLGNSVKPIFGIYAVATAISLFVVFLRAETVSLCRSFLPVSVFVAFVITEIFTSSLVLRGTEAMFDISLRAVNPTPHFLCVGLNRQGEGQIHVGGLSRLWNMLISEGMSPKDATRQTCDAVMGDWQEHTGDILPFLMKKFVWTWQDDNRPYGMAMLQLGKGLGAKILDDNDREAMAKKIVKRELGDEGSSAAAGDKSPSSRALFVDSVWQTIQTAGFVVYFSIMLSAVVGVLLYRRRLTVNACCLWVCLFVLGFWCLMVLSEAASRYKSIVMPYVFLLMAPFVARLIKMQVNSAACARDDEC